MSTWLARTRGGIRGQVRGRLLRRRPVVTARASGRPVPARVRWTFAMLVFWCLAVTVSRAAEERRFESDIQAMLAADRKQPPRPGGILFVGSSIFRLWTNVAEMMAPLPVRNRAFGGSRTGDQLDRFEQVVVPAAPRVVVYYCGSNDLKAGDDPEAIFARFRAFSERLRAEFPSVRLIFASATRSPDREARWDRVDRYNRLVRDHCAATVGHTFVDLNPVLFDAAGRPRHELYLADQLHFHPPAYVEFARVLRPVLERVWQEVAPEPLRRGWTLGPFQKHPRPVLEPDPEARFHCPVLGREVRWAAQNVYNPAAVVRDGKVYLFYRADDRNPALKWGRTCRIGMAWSRDGTNFVRHPVPVVHPDNDAWKEHEWEGGCEDLHIVEDEAGVAYMNYTTWNGRSDTVSVASSRDLVHWTKHGPAFAKAGRKDGRSGVVLTRLVGDRLVAARVDGKYWMYYTHPCALAWSTNLVDWVPAGRSVWPGGGREAGAIAWWRDDGVLLLTQGGHRSLGAWTLRQTLIDPRDLVTIRRDDPEPFLYPELDWERRGMTGNTTVANALVPFRGRWLLYYGGGDTVTGLAVGPAVATP